MLNIKSLPILLKIVSKLDMLPIVEKLKELDIFKDTKDPQEALNQLKGEKMMEAGFEVLSVLTPQLEKIADFIPELAAAYKEITVEEAEKLDALALISEIINDEGIKAFFSSALQKKAEREL